MILPNGNRSSPRPPLGPRRSERRFSSFLKHARSRVLSGPLARDADGIQVDPGLPVKTLQPNPPARAGCGGAGTGSDAGCGICGRNSTSNRSIRPARIGRGRDRTAAPPGASSSPTRCFGATNPGPCRRLRGCLRGESRQGVVYLAVFHTDQPSFERWRAYVTHSEPDKARPRTERNNPIRARPDAWIPVRSIGPLVGSGGGGCGVDGGVRRRCSEVAASPTQDRGAGAVRTGDGGDNRRYLRSAFRSGYSTGHRYRSIGFRVARTVTP